MRKSGFSSRAGKVEKNFISWEEEVVHLLGQKTSMEAVSRLSEKELGHALDTVLRMGAADEKKKRAGLGERNIPFFGEARWKEFFLLLSQAYREGEDPLLPRSPESLLLAMWNFRSNPDKFLSGVDGELLFGHFPSREALFLYQILNFDSFKSGHHLWGRVGDVLKFSQGEPSIPMDIFLAMEASPENSLSPEMISYNDKLFGGIIKHTAKTIEAEVAGWVDNKGGFPAPFDISALFGEWERRIKGKHALLNISAETLNKGALYPIKPIYSFGRAAGANERELFGSAASLYLQTPALCEELWFDRDGDTLERVKNIGVFHTRQFRRALLGSSLPWSFEKTDENLYKLFFDIACPPGVPSPDKPEHPAKAEYFIRMPDSMSVNETVKISGYTIPLYEYFLRKNMMPYIQEGGLDYLNALSAPSAKALLPAEQYLKWLAESVSEGPSVWQKAGRAVFLNCLVCGYIHPDMESGISFVPLDGLLTRLSGENRTERYEKAIQRTVEAFSLLLINTVQKGSSGKEITLFSTSWDKEVSTRVAFSLGNLATKHPSPLWSETIRRCIVSPPEKISWVCSENGEDKKVREIKGLAGVFEQIAGDGFDERFRETQDKLKPDSVFFMEL